MFWKLSFNVQFVLLRNVTYFAERLAGIKPKIYSCHFFVSSAMLIIRSLLYVRNACVSFEIWGFMKDGGINKT